MIKRLFTKPQTSILSAAFVIGAMVAASRVLGLFRDRLLTGRFTADELGVYFAAFRLPNLIFELLVMGAISVAFIPVFTSYISRNKKDAAFSIASSIINLSMLFFAVITVLFLIFTDSIDRVIAPGLNESELVLMASFTRIMLLFQVFPLIVGNFFTGILQSFKQFLIPALAPVVYNVGIIIGIFFLSPSFGLYGAVFGVGIGAILFFLIQLPFLTGVGYRHRFVIDTKNPGVREVGKLMLPRTIGIAASQIDTTVDLMLSSLLGARSITIFNLAQHLQLLPIGLFGLTIAQAALPTLSEYIAKNEFEQFKKTFLTSFHQILFFIFPFSALLIVLRIPVVRLVFGADRFDWPATVLTGQTLAFFAVSLFAQGVTQLLARAFFALHDSMTPVKISVVSILLNTVLSVIFILVLHYPVWALAFATSIASILQAVLLLYFLSKKMGGFERARLIIPMIKIMAATIITAFFLYVPMKLLDQLVFDTTRTFNLILLTGITSVIGLLVYLFFVWFFNIEEIVLFFKLAHKLIKVKDILFEPSREMVAEKN